MAGDGGSRPDQPLSPQEARRLAQEARRNRAPAPGSDPGVDDDTPTPPRRILVPLGLRPPDIAPVIPPPPGAPRSPDTAPSIPPPPLPPTSPDTGPSWWRRLIPEDSVEKTKRGAGWLYSSIMTNDQLKANLLTGGALGLARMGFTWGFGPASWAATAGFGVAGGVRSGIAKFAGERQRERQEIEARVNTASADISSLSPEALAQLHQDTEKLDSMTSRNFWQLTEKWNDLSVEKKDNVKKALARGIVISTATSLIGMGIRESGLADAAYDKLVEVLSNRTTAENLSVLFGGLTGAAGSLAERYFREVRKTGNKRDLLTKRSIIQTAVAAAIVGAGGEFGLQLVSNISKNISTPNWGVLSGPREVPTPRIIETRPTTTPVPKPQEAPPSPISSPSPKPEEVTPVPVPAASPIASPPAEAVSSPSPISSPAPERPVASPSPAASPAASPEAVPSPSPVPSRRLTPNAFLPNEGGRDALASGVLEDTSVMSFMKTNEPVNLEIYKAARTGEIFDQIEAAKKNGSLRLTTAFTDRYNDNLDPSDKGVLDKPTVRDVVNKEPTAPFKLVDPDLRSSLGPEWSSLKGDIEGQIGRDFFTNRDPKIIGELEEVIKNRQANLQPGEKGVFFGDENPEIKDEDKFWNKFKAGKITNFDPYNDANHERVLRMLEKLPKGTAGRDLYDREYLGAYAKFKLDHPEDPTKPGSIFHKDNPDYIRHGVDYKVNPNIVADLRKAA